MGGGGDTKTYGILKFIEVSFKLDSVLLTEGTIPDPSACHLERTSLITIRGLRFNESRGGGGATDYIHLWLIQ